MIKNPSELLNGRVSIVYSEKSDGNMSFKVGDQQESADNRRKLMKKLGIISAVYMRAFHGLDVSELTLADAGRGLRDLESAPRADAMITKQRLALCMVPADCPPAVLYDPVTETLAHVHLSWITTDHKILLKVIKILSESYGARPRDLLAYIGPGIKAETYVFDNPTQKQMPEWAPFLRDREDGMTEVDIFAYNVAQLQWAGVLPGNIEVSEINTATDKRLFSHYQAVNEGEEEGRYTALAMLGN